MKTPLFLTLLLAGAPSFADPVFSLPGDNKLRIEWAGTCDRQYEVLCSTDLENWTRFGNRLLGFDGTMSVEDSILLEDAKYYRVEESPDFVIDLERLKFGTVGNKWVYDVSENQGFGPELYTWDTEIMQRTTFAGEDVVEWCFLRSGITDQTIYILDDFSTAIYEVGGVDSFEGPQTNTPFATSMLASFTPGVPVDTTYTSSAIGLVEQFTTITIEKALVVVVPAGNFTNAIKVVSDWEAEFMGFAVTGTTTEWFALDVGLLKHVGVVDAAGTTALTTFELVSYEVD